MSNSKGGSKPSSKDEARLEAARRIAEKALSSEKAARAEVQDLKDRVKASEDLASRLAADLAAAGARIVKEESIARMHSGQVVMLGHELEGAKADLLATTRRVVVGEAVLKDASSRIESLRSTLEQIATWPIAYSDEAKGMRDIAARGLFTDQLRRRLSVNV